MIDPIARLAVADPDIAGAVADALAPKADRVSRTDKALLTEETLWGLGVEYLLGKSYAAGLADLLGDVGSEALADYQSQVRKAAETGPTLARFMAAHLPPALKCNRDGLYHAFFRTVDIMRAKGAYTLPSPMALFSELLNHRRVDAALAYLDLLGTAFSADITYNESLRLSHTIPRAVRGFSKAKQTWQITALERVIRKTTDLADPFITGMEKGLNLLSEAALERFVALGLEKFDRSQDLGAKFLSLQSALGRDTWSDLRVSVSLNEMQHGLNRYLWARTGQGVSVRTLTALPEWRRAADDEADADIPGPQAISDGRFIHLPPEIEHFPSKAENAALYKCLTRLEAGYYEFGTFDFDLERAEDACTGVRTSAPEGPDGEGPAQSDLERFFACFPIKELAEDLFTVFEHARLRVRTARLYPGLARQAFPLLRQEAFRLKNPTDHPLVRHLYMVLALGFPLNDLVVSETYADTIDALGKRFQAAVESADAVETSAVLVAQAYDTVAAVLVEDGTSPLSYSPLRIPFGRKIRPDLYFANFQAQDKTAESIRERLKQAGVHVYKSNLRKQIIKRRGGISAEDIRVAIQKARNCPGAGSGEENAERYDLSGLDLSDILGPDPSIYLAEEDAAGDVFWYPEWSDHLGDYLADHVRVLDRRAEGVASDFYPETLKTYHGLVRRIRYAFELLKPEGLTILRQWIEGDEFDYRALLDFVMDRRAGRTPSERLYIKRVKQQRDVAVLLLTDLSRSTANAVPAPSGAAEADRVSVLDVEKQAIVLFCEALEVVGDAFAIAGFSGTGRLGVDYFRIKDFGEGMTDAVRKRINAMAPQRNTRMGGAIRHAMSELDAVSARVRILIILGDGFPNDLDYKKGYAAADTRRSILEARSKGIFTRAITVNLGEDPGLDDLYGRTDHNVISDVRELPGRLLRIYSALTR